MVVPRVVFAVSPHIASMLCECTLPLSKWRLGAGPAFITAGGPGVFSTCFVHGQYSPYRLGAIPTSHSQLEFIDCLSCVEVFLQCFLSGQQ